MTRLRRVVLGAAAMVSLACQPPVAPAAPAGDLHGADEFEPTDLEPAEPANKATGDLVELTIPGVEGEFIDLASLRGKTVVLAISGTSEARFDELLTWLEGIQKAAPDQRRGVLVASDPEPDALDGVMSPLLLGWDPQGAVAARLSVARLPTVFVIDVQGRVVVVRPDFEEADRQALEAAL